MQHGYMTNTRMVSTPELHLGDVVWTYGLRVRLDTLRVYETDGRDVYAFKGTILNPEYLATERGRFLFGGIQPLGSTSWTVQGNHLAHWNKES